MMQEIVHPRCLKCHAGDVLVPMSTIRGELKRPPQVVGLCFTFPQWQELKDHSTTLKQASYGHSMRVKTATTKVKVGEVEKCDGLPCCVPKCALLGQKPAQTRQGRIAVLINVKIISVIAVKIIKSRSAHQDIK